jgi:hypothetical protein
MPWSGGQRIDISGAMPGTIASNNGTLPCCFLLYVTPNRTPKPTQTFPWKCAGHLGRRRTASPIDQCSAAPFCGMEDLEQSRGLAN